MDASSCILVMYPAFFFFFEYSITFWHYKMFQPCLVPALPQPWNHPFLQGPLVSFSWEWYGRLRSVGWHVHCHWVSLLLCTAFFLTAAGISQDGCTPAHPLPCRWLLRVLPVCPCFPQLSGSIPVHASCASVQGVSPRPGGEKRSYWFVVCVADVLSY